MTERKIRQRIYKQLSPEENIEFDRLAEEAEREAPRIKAQAREYFAANTRLRELVALLKTERERQGLSLSDVAQRIGMDPANLHRLENNPNANPTLETLQRLARAVGKQIRVELIDSKDPRSPRNPRAAA